MAKKVFNMQGGRHSAAALSAFINAMYGSSVANGLDVQVTGSAGLNVLVKVGNGNINTGSGFGRLIQIDADETVALTAASASNPRNDIIVGYIDNSVTPTTSVTDNTNNILKFMAVAGTPASSPIDPTGSTIQAAVGAGNPYIILGRVRVNTSATSLVAGNITDLRKLVVPLASDSVGAVNSQMIADGTIANADIANSTVALGKLDYSTFPSSQSTSVKNASAKSMAVAETYYFPDTITITLTKPTAVMINVSCAMILPGDSEYWLYIRDQTLGTNVWQYNPPAAISQGPRASYRGTTWVGVLAAGTHVMAMGVGTVGGAGGNISVGSITMSALVGLPTTN